MPRLKKNGEPVTNGYKSTDFEIDERVSHVYSMLLRGARRIEICRYATSNWNISDRTVDTYIVLATERLRAISLRISEEEFNKAVGRLEEIFFRFMSERDYKSAVMVQRELSDLFGLREIKLKVSGGIDINVLTDEEKVRLEKEYGFIKRRPLLEGNTTDLMDGNKTPSNTQN